MSDEVNQHLLVLVEENLPIPRWRGLRAVAAESSAVRLTVMKETVPSIITGIAFGLYLSGIELFMDFRVYGFRPMNVRYSLRRSMRCAATMLS